MIGEFIKKKRKEKKITLQKMADYIGTDITMMSKIENEKRKLPSRLIPKLSNLLGVSEQDIQSMVIAQDIIGKYGNSSSLKIALARATSMVKK